MKGSRDCPRRVKRKKRFISTVIRDRINSCSTYSVIRFDTYFKKKKLLPIFRSVEGFDFALKYRDKGGEEKREKMRENTKTNQQEADTRLPTRGREVADECTYDKRGGEFEAYFSARIEGYNRDRI